MLYSDVQLIVESYWEVKLNLLNEKIFQENVIKLEQNLLLHLVF